MEVELYDVLEMGVDLEKEPDLESIALITELDLKGQLTQVNDNNERLPYQMITMEQNVIMSALFGSFQKISDYDKGPIPYRVLKEAKVAKEHFKHLYIVFDTPAEDKDPILLGVNDEFQTWKGKEEVYKNSFLIARWGEALEDWGVLMKKALARNKDIGIAKFTEVMAYFEGIKAGILNGHIAINSNLSVDNVISSIVKKDANSIY